MPAPKRDVEDDPVVGEYDVYITENLLEKFHLLQFPIRNRDRPYNEDSRNKPVAVRVKPTTGFLEIDVPAQAAGNYDQQRAAAWSEVLAKAKAEGADGFGMAVGFHNTARGRKEREITEDTSQFMSYQTLGGQILHDEHGKPNYMIGTFDSKKHELHLTSLDGIVQMRPQFHHIDAKIVTDKNRARREREATEGPSAKAQIVQMSYTSFDPDQVDINATKALLQSAADENWATLKYNDEEDDVSYDEFKDHLYIRDQYKTRELISAMDNDKYLDAISAPRLDSKGNPRTKPMTKRQKAQIELSETELEHDHEHDNEGSEGQGGRDGDASMFLG